MSNIKMHKEAKLLIVEDEKPLRELLEMELTRSGYKVESAANGEEGLEKYRQEVLNVVLLVMRMPGMDGVEVLKQMRTESTIPEVIVFTGHGTIETAVECIKHGAYDYLTKPVKLDELEMVIDKAYDKNRLRLENISLMLEINKLDQHHIVGKSQVIQKVLETARRWGPTDEHVLISGESGAGKELFARAVHDASRRAAKPFVTVNCGRLNVNTAESERFGHVQGAFTGATKGRAGLFELADTGTLFMDEISEMPLDVQVKLLRIIETSTFRRMGGNHDIRVNVRFFIQQCNENDARSWEITDEAMASLCSYQWPGNVRELRNTIRRACILANEPIITPDLFPFAPQKAVYSPAANGK